MKRKADTSLDNEINPIKRPITVKSSSSSSSEDKLGLKTCCKCSKYTHIYITFRKDIYCFRCYNTFHGSQSSSSKSDSNEVKFSSSSTSDSGFVSSSIINEDEDPYHFDDFDLLDDPLTQDIDWTF